MPGPKVVKICSFENGTAEVCISVPLVVTICLSEGWNDWSLYISSQSDYNLFV